MAAFKFDPALLEFDAETHRYWYDRANNPEPVDSVTQILDAEGLYNPFVVDKVAAEFGTYLHRVVELYLSGKLQSVHPDFEPWMPGIRQFVNDFMPCPEEEGLELRGYCPEGYAFTADFYGRLGKNHCNRFPKSWMSRPVVLDWKSYASVTKEFVWKSGLQLSGYARGIRSNRALSYSPNRAIVHFGKVGYTVIPLTDPSHEPAWMHCLGWHNSKKPYTREGKKND